MHNMTQPTREADVKRGWHLIDAKGKILGRVSSEIAQLLMGKSKPYFAKNIDCGDYVVVINAKDVTVTGKKETQKRYHRHSGFPGGYKSETFQELNVRKPEDVVTYGVKGMLPQNKLRDGMLQRLHVFAGETHSFAKELGEK